MVKIKYKIRNDIYAYEITCPEELIDKYIKLLCENGAYEIII